MRLGSLQFVCMRNVLFTEILLLGTTSVSLGASWPQDFFLKVKLCQTVMWFNLILIMNQKGLKIKISE